MARTPRAPALAAVCLAAALAALPAAAQQTGGTAATPAGAALPTPSLRTARATTPPRIDGRLDDAAWASAEAATGFTQQRPSSGSPSTQRTEARVLYDDQAVYVAARMHDTRPDSVAAQLARRDASGIYSDWFHVVIDSYHDRRTAFRFAVNPAGVQKDVFHSNDNNEDLDWDAVWEVATARDSAGWTAEFRIPLSQLRYGKVAAGTEQVWGVNFLRDIARRDERSYWSHLPPNYPGFVSRAGELRGITGLPSPRRLEILPYTSARLDREPTRDGDPFNDGSDAGASVGADLKVGLPAGLTLTATLNPDFGQVEVDPAVVNLSAFETFFPEKRPFFVEGADIFRFGQFRSFNNFGMGDFFYPRRIGRAPQRSLGDEFDWYDQPSQSTILGAAKVSGKTPGGWSVGVMDAVTQRETGRYLAEGGETLETAVEPLTNYFTARVRRDLRGGSTVIGGMASAVNRSLGGGGEFDALLRGNAYSGGIDWEHAWSNRLWTLSGFAAATRVHGSPEVIVSTQRSSARYFQRPDAGYVRVDSSRTSLSGWSGALSLQRSGDYDLSLTYQENSPGFETNDLGFLGNADRRAFSTFLGRRVSRESRLFRSHSYYAYTNHSWNFGGDNVFEQYAAGGNGTFHNLWNVGATVRIDGESASDRLTRGGPLSRNPRARALELDGGTDSRRRLSASAYGSVREEDGGGFRRSGGLTFSLRPSSSVQLSLGPALTRERGSAQYVRGVNDSTATFGRRHVFADVDQTTISMDTRLDWTFTPTLSLQLFAQPFVSAGDFSNYKEFRTPGAREFDVYGRDRGTIERVEDDGGATYLVDPDGAGPAAAFDFSERDFTVRSLRGNAVLRWEYRPGSALFLVWQQERSAGHLFGDVQAGRDFRGIFTEPARNVFLVKATYWLSR